LTIGHDRQRDLRDQGRTEALQATAGDQHAGGLGESVEQRRAAEHEHPGNEDAPASEQVSGSATKQQQSAEHQRVAVDHPLQVGGREMQVVLDRRERDVDDGEV
jgi:hypothetical protein